MVLLILSVNTLCLLALFSCCCNIPQIFKGFIYNIPSKWRHNILFLQIRNKSKRICLLGVGYLAYLTSLGKNRTSIIKYNICFYVGFFNIKIFKSFIFVMLKAAVIHKSCSGNNNSKSNTYHSRHMPFWSCTWTTIYLHPLEHPINQQDSVFMTQLPNEKICLHCVAWKYRACI